jgi:mono/diheme cytochrome c family protein
VGALAIGPSREPARDLSSRAEFGKVPVAQPDLAPGLRPAARQVASPGSTATSRSGGSPTVDAASARALLDRYCVACHNSKTPTSASAGVALDRSNTAQLESDKELWERVIRKMNAGAMPPAGMPKPDAKTHDAFVSYLETTLDRIATAEANPGRPAAHRMNRAEYANSIRDLLALEIDPAELLPPDDSSDGFDNNADILGVSPALLERYLSAAAKVSALAIGSEAISASSQTYRIRGDASQYEHKEGLPLGTRGGISAVHTFPLDGEYQFKVKLLETNLGSIRGLEQESQLEITVGGERVLLAPVGGEADYVESSKNATNVVNALDTRLQVRVKVRAGQHAVTAAFLHKSSALGPTRLQPFVRSTVIATDHLGYPHVENMTVSGPFGATAGTDTPSRQRIFICRPTSASDEQACARRIVNNLARRAYRRPVTSSELTSLMRFYDEGRKQDFEAGVGLALRAIIASPLFVFRVERDPVHATPGRPYALPDVDVASRLSFFLWSSIPDDSLLQAAEKGTLKTASARQAQVKRMLADPRSESLVANFAQQWLHVRNLRSATPDKNDFPDFDDNLRQAFEEELDLFFASIVREDRSVLDLMNADYTFVNERLARHYGIPNVYGSHFRRVKLTDERRFGLLGKGGILLVTSHADRTSPVVRGKWILDNLIGTPPAPPPPDVPGLPDTTTNKPQTMRERMVSHRANPVCASCHRVMDPLGLALENFDAVGSWREFDGGSKIDASGELGDGTKVDGVVSLRRALLARPDVIVKTMAEKLLIYALGRGLEPDDMPAVRGIVRHAARNDYRFSALVDGVVSSAPFLMRTADGSATTRLASASN